MKIIGDITNGHIVEVSKHEIALILGVINVHTDGYAKANVKIGTEIDIRKINQAADFLRSMDEGKIASIKKALYSAVDELDDALDNARAIKLFDKLKEVTYEE